MSGDAFAHEAQDLRNYAIVGLSRQVDDAKLGLPNGTLKAVSDRLGAAFSPRQLQKMSYGELSQNVAKALKSHVDWRSDELTKAGQEANKKRITEAEEEKRKRLAELESEDRMRTGIPARVRL